MIKPTVGRIVWVRRNESIDKAQPEAAMVCYVHGDGRLINVKGADHNGGDFVLTSLYLLQDEDDNQIPPWPYAEWMPFQKGQAAKS